MVPRSECPLLGFSPFIGFIADEGRVRAVNAPVGLHPLKVFRGTHAIFHGPDCSLAQKFSLIVIGEP
jgi:hypothetical protein